MTCTFFGHSDFSDKFAYKIKEVVSDLILNHNVDRFYVGNQGNFDACARKVLRDLKEIYPHISYYVVAAYLPRVNEYGISDNSDTIMFDGFESVPRKYAISYRNNWMIKKADYVVTYINHTHTTGGAAQFAEKAEKAKKIVINIAKKQIKRDVVGAIPYTTKT